MRRKAAMSNIPKGYKKTEVGVIPEDWGVKKLGKVERLFPIIKQQNEY